MNLFEGYRVMLCFLNAYYFKHKSDELGILLGSMSFAADNIPMDSACMADWEVAVSQVIGIEKSDGLSSAEAYKSMIAYLRNWAAIGTDGTIESLWISLDKSCSEANEWQNALKIVISNDDDPYINLSNPTI